MLQNCIAIMIAILGVLCSSAGVYAGKIVIVDGSDLSPVAGVTLIANSGLILGMTETDGSINVAADAIAPITIRCLGYKPLLCNELADTIRLEVESYPLAEVNVAPADRPITRVLFNAREYCSGATANDTAQIYGIYMVECFLADKSVKGYKKEDGRAKVRARKLYTRTAKSDGTDSVSTATARNEDSMPSFVEMCDFNVNTMQDEPEKIVAGAISYSEPGKFGPKTSHRKSNGIYKVSTDMLADQKDHRYSPLLLKMLGATMVFKKMQITSAYQVGSSPKHSADDMIYKTVALNLSAEGKLIKKALGVDSNIDLSGYIEFYPVEVMHLTVDEYKEARKETGEIKFIEPKTALPMVPAVKRIVEKVKSKESSK